VAIPDKTRKIQVGVPMLEIFSWLDATATVQTKIGITTVRIAVARLELIFCTPIFARIAVRPAKKAERSAQISQY
jgi:hypothetical protein